MTKHLFSLLLEHSFKQEMFNSTGNVFFPAFSASHPAASQSCGTGACPQLTPCPVGSSPLPPGISLQRRHRGQRVKPTSDPARADMDPPEEKRGTRSRLANAAGVWRSRYGPHPRTGRGSDPFPQAPLPGAPQSSQSSGPRPLPPGPGATHSVCPQTFTISFREGLRYLVVLHRGQPRSSMAASRSPPSSHRAFRLPVPPPKGPAAAQRHPARSARVPAPTPPARARTSPGGSACPAAGLWGCPGPRAPVVIGGDGGVAYD